MLQSNVKYTAFVYTVGCVSIQHGEPCIDRYSSDVRWVMCKEVPHEVQTTDSQKTILTYNEKGETDRWINEQGLRQDWLMSTRKKRIERCAIYPK